MEIIPDKKYAVITGDIIGSTKLEPESRRKLFDVMQECSETLRLNYSEVLPYEIDIFSGDSWQMLIIDPALSLRIALFYRASLRSMMESHDFDTRMFIGIGPIQFIPENRISSGDGEAFQLSGRNLEGMKKNRLGIACPDHPYEHELKIVVELIDAIATHWTDRQARAITGALLNLKQSEISKLWDPEITQQSTSEFLDLASWHAVEKGLYYCEHKLKQVNIPVIDKNR